MSFTLLRPRRIIRAAAVLLLVAVSLPRIAAAQALYHVLEKGETLYSVAKSYGVRPEAIVKANSIDDPSKLKAGKKLLIPRDAVAGDPVAGDPVAGDPVAGDASVDPAPALTHRVAKGETLFSIAKAYGISLDALMAANKLTAASVIRAGAILSIPAGGKAVAVVPAMPEAVKTSTKALSKSLAWPCPGEIRYLDGKAYGVVIRASLGETSKAIAAGIVSSAGPYRGYGNVVFVLTRGYIYVYGGNDSISVRAGDQVRAGQALGKIGMDAKQGGPAAYFLVFKDGAAVDPAAAPRD